jgi:hypothetical protein
MSPLSALSRHSPSTGSFKAATEPIKADRGNLRHGSDPLRFLDLLILARPTLVEGAIHDITLTGIGRIEANSVVLIASSSNLGRDFPFRHGVEAVKMGGKSGAVGARWDEEVPDGGEHRGEPRQASWRSEALHRPLSSAQGQMRILCSVVKRFVRPVFDGWHDLTPSSGVGT